MITSTASRVVLYRLADLATDYDGFGWLAIKLSENYIRSIKDKAHTEGHITHACSDMDYYDNIRKSDVRLLTT